MSAAHLCWITLTWDVALIDRNTLGIVRDIVNDSEIAPTATIESAFHVGIVVANSGALGDTT
jgi:hypothetical protein